MSDQPTQEQLKTDAAKPAEVPRRTEQARQADTAQRNDRRDITGKGDATKQASGARQSDRGDTTGRGDMAKQPETGRTDGRRDITGRGDATKQADGVRQSDRRRVTGQSDAAKQAEASRADVRRDITGRGDATRQDDGAKRGDRTNTHSGNDAASDHRTGDRHTMAPDEVVPFVQQRIGEVNALYRFYKSTDTSLNKHAAEDSGFFTPKTLEMVKWIDNHPEAQEVLDAFQKQQEEIHRLDEQTLRIGGEDGYSGFPEQMREHEREQLAEQIREGVTIVTSNVFGAIGMGIAQHFYPDD